MCGIFTLISCKNTICQEFISDKFLSGKNRGPEFSKLVKIDDEYDISNELNIYMGFHRLAINGLNEKGNQPIIIDKIALICNGEIYNYDHLFITMKIEQETTSDCEVIIHLYKKYGIKQTLNMLDGVFSFVLYDMNKDEIYVARDPFGVRPLFILIDNNTKKGVNKNIIIGSEMKMITDFFYSMDNYDNNNNLIKQFQPGSYTYIKLKNDDFSIVENSKYFHMSFASYFSDDILESENIYKKISHYLNMAVYKRVITTDRPIACLLSGGLDSSLITSLVANHVYNIYNRQIETYSIGLEGSDDILKARIVAKHLNTKHNEIILTEQEFLDAIPEVIYKIESYDTTTVRASVGNYLVSKYISENSDAKVIFNGDGADEVMGGYLYFHACRDPIEFDKECRRLLENIHYYDVLRSDRTISSCGLEARTPFLDRFFVQYYLSINPLLRCHSKQDMPEKFLVRESFSRFNINVIVNNKKEIKECLPKEILWRTKEAFSDGVSKQTRSWYVIIQEYLEKNNCNVEVNNTTYNIPTTKEQKYYRSLFDKYYNNCYHTIPYFWMPKYVKANDSSARTLNMYKYKIRQNTDLYDKNINNNKEKNIFSDFANSSKWFFEQIGPRVEI